ncbi:LacI family DNA-binding transcriptional regulator [Rathayibacter sp. VKM Ac-2803]|uniref:LacI family DNA-binding transcriptional regulator n=1 Tax=Rathayibacter sp. VKM Ac-2803 TaxID=2609256 RepID=UPI00135B0723|nr:LacI family DNA-binding transcriptional regulator [Rathayibacter sp. VKM Ac-2803]MWV48880.1 LacI family DNA-binding transcriptional regulator [Rathayibacter sp. VKM Ac-2803]
MSSIDSINGHATIQDVAQRAGVSRAAVSKVIRNAYGVSPSMRERVTAAIDELDYRPSVAARAMRGSSFTIGVEVPHLGNAFFNRIVTGASAALEGSRYQLIVAPAQSDSGEGFRAIEALVDRQVDGLIAVSPMVEPAWLERLARRTPIVMLGRHDDSTGYDTVTNDDVSGTDAVMDHLFALGHRRIAHLTVSEQITGRVAGAPHSVRLVRYEHRMHEAGLADQVQVLHLDPVVENARARSLEVFLSPDRPTALFAGNDSLALDALWARDDAGLTSADLAIVGYDDIEVAGHPGISLTTVDQYGEELGDRAVRLLLERLDGRTEAVHFERTPILRVRDSSGPPRH